MEIGLFPLNLVLLPGEQAPLHIFEPRYRELIGECLDQGGEFGLVLSDDEGMREVGCRAGVIEVLDQEGRVRFTSQSPRSPREFAGLRQIIEGLTWIEEL